MEFKYMEINMHSMLRWHVLLITVLLSKLLIGLFYSEGRYFVAKDPLDQVLARVLDSSEYFHSAILLYTYQYKTKCTFELASYTLLSLTFSVH